MPVQLLAQLCPNSGHELLELDRGSSLSLSPGPWELCGYSEGQQRVGSERARAAAWITCTSMPACVCVQCSVCLAHYRPIALAAAEPKLVQSSPAVHVRVNCSGVLVES